jgi:3-oxoacyl-(acyl-carrier-protein) synthase
LIVVQLAASGTMRTFAGACAIGALSSVAGALAFGAIASGVTDIALGVCFDHNFLLTRSGGLIVAGFRFPSASPL